MRRCHCFNGILLAILHVYAVSNAYVFPSFPDLEPVGKYAICISFAPICLPHDGRQKLSLVAYYLHIILIKF